MVGWFGTAALALVGGLKGQGNPWRQIPLVGVLAATALFISWRVRHSREKDTSKAASLDDKTVVEVNTRVYLVYDEEKKLERTTSLSQSPPTSSDLELEKFPNTEDLGSTSVEVEIVADNFQISDRQNLERLENKTGWESLSRTVSVSKGDPDCRVVEEISKAEATSHFERTSVPSEPSIYPASKITDISVSGFILPQLKGQKFFIRPEIQTGEPYAFELGPDPLEDVTEDSLSYCPVDDATHHQKDVIPVMVSDVVSNGTTKDDYSSVFGHDGDPKQIILGQMERFEKVVKVVDHHSASTLTPVENGNALCENENKMVSLSNRNRESLQLPVHSVEDFVSSHSSPVRYASDISGVRKEEAASDRGSSTSSEVRATWISPELQLNDWVCRRGDSELEDGRLARPASATESHPSPVAESIPGSFPFSSYSTLESCGSDVMDSKDQCLLHSPSNNVKRVISPVKDFQQDTPDSRKSSEEDYAERLRIYDEYLGDPSLSPRMRSQVLRAKATLERLSYDSD